MKTETEREYTIKQGHYGAIKTVKMTLDQVAAILARHGFSDFAPSKISPGAAVATDPATGWKVAVDTTTGDWCHYRGRTERMTEGEGFQVMDRWLARFAI
jgi:hypothetical protein